MKEGVAVLLPRRTHLTAAVWGLTALEGVFALAALLRLPSEPGSAFLLGYSRSRLALAGLTALGVAGLAVAAIAALRQPGWWRRAAGTAGRFFTSPARAFAVGAALAALFLTLAALLALALIPTPGGTVLPRSLFDRAGLLAIWFELAILQAGFLIFRHHLLTGDRRGFFSPLRLAILLAIVTIVYTATLKVFTTATYDIRMRGLENYIFLPTVIFLVWGLTYQFFRERTWYAAFSRVLLPVSVGVIAYTLFRHTAQWVSWQNTPSKAYWDELAGAFLQGRLYLENPGTTHDLTFYNGHWFVPNPPLPALVMLPLIALLGPGNLNTVLFSILLGALDVVLVFLALEKASGLGLIPTGRPGNLWLTGVFALGTSFWWLAIMGRAWFISQVLTLTFTLLAAIVALYRRSPWLVGLCLGLAVLARPNAFTLWPLMAGIVLYLENQVAGGIRWRHALGWAVQSAVPICLAAAGLLYYNYLRFDNFLDFGYVSITSAEWLTQAVRTYGIFNAHFVPINLNAMFLKLPILEMRGGCLYYSPTREGISILAMMPAAVYVFRRMRINWWTAGAWAAVLLSIGLLLFYHNTGSWQMGYRYMMDFILPVLLLMALGIGARVSWFFKGLVLLSILINAAGILWWFNMWPCG